MADPYCEHLASPDPWVLALSIFLVVGILVSYLPQHYKIISLSSSAGLSPWWVLLGTVSSIAGLTNIIVLPTSQHDMACCREISGSACTAALLGIVQVGLQWACFMIIMVLFLAFFPRRTDTEQIQAIPDEAEEELPKPRDAVIVGSICLVALLFAGLGSLFFIVQAPAQLLGWANFLGVTASILASIQYIPQIWTTYRMGRVLSLSIITMLIQVPGAFLFAFSLYLRVGAQGWSSWLVYCVTGVFQGCLLAMAIRFWIRDKRLERYEDRILEEERTRNEPNERDPLLATRRMSTGRSTGSSTLRTTNGDKTRDGRSNGPLDTLYQPTPPEYNSLSSDSNAVNGRQASEEHTSEESGPESVRQR
ncbi:hypothetical protein CAC42_1722 [Sphaceloma murrayae]|uniref:PQ loop repeat protein n=1 Tax=Sphaceloma murrayae TaxID=2082308 RepID=A0A2K1QIH7_9PEZI|nr:hypothetical protein CAC42_1722 [Sphaceloma murrayae]